MKQKKTKHKVSGNHSLLVLTIGLIMSMLFIAVSVFIPIAETSRIQEQAITIFSEGEQETYLLGNLSNQLTRIHLTLRELTDSETILKDDSSEDYYQMEGRLTEIMRQLPPLLHPAEERDWAVISLEIEQLREAYREILSLMEQEKQQAAHDLLDVTSIRAKGIFDSISILSQKNREVINTILAETEESHTFILMIEAVAGISLGIAILLVWLAVIRIIQQQRRRIEQSLLELEMSNRDLDSFTGRIAHEIKNLMAPVPLLIENLKRARDKPDKVMAISANLEEFTARSYKIMDGLLTFSQSGQQTHEQESAFLADEIKATVDELRPITEQIEATLDLTKIRNFEVNCSPALLHVIIRNLLHNALKFMENRPTRKIQLATYIENKRWGVFIVNDTGPGISPEDISKIFMPFYRVPGVKVSGTGIGLSTVKRIVYAYGGSIDVKSVLDNGSQFTVRLPLKQND